MTMMKSSRRVVVALVALSSLMFVADGARAQSKVQAGTLTLGWVKSTANLMAFIAPKLSEKYGLKIETAYFNTAVDISTAMISGQVDVGLLTPIHLIRAIENDIDFVQIAGNTRGNTGIVASTKLGLKDNDWDGFKTLLKTKKIKVASSRGSINELLAIAEFAKHGINVDKDLDLINVANFSQHPQALRSGDFDMIVTLEPFPGLTVTEGIGTLFSKPYDTAAGDLNTDYVVRRDWLSKNPEKAQAFVATLKDAAEQLSKDKAGELKTAEALTGLKPEALERAMANNRYELRNGLSQMKELARLSFERKYSGKDVSAKLEGHVTDKFLKAAGIHD